MLKNSCDTIVSPVSHSFALSALSTIADMSLSEKKSQVILSFLIAVAYVLKENVEGIILSLEGLSTKTEHFLKEGF